MIPKNLKIIEFIEVEGGVTLERVAMFNSSVINPEKVYTVIKAQGSFIPHKEIVFMSKTQYENLKDPVAKDTTQTELLEDLMVEQKEQM